MLTKEERKLVKILFICSSLEPEQDGVGDYTRKLAQALITKGHEIKIIALNDRRMQGAAWRGKQFDTGVAVEVLRLAESLPWKIRLDTAKKFVNDFSPGWISLQFVPFGYQIKGLPFNLGKKLSRLSKKARWHVMFHEISVNKKESFKFRVWALLQLHIIKSLLKRVQPACITTNTEVYRHQLQELGYTCAVLPLFSNIERLATCETDRFSAKLPAFLLTDRSACLTGTLFGTFSYKSWNLHSLCGKLSAQYPKKKLVIASIGKMSSGEEYWESLKDSYPAVIFLELGMQDEAFISWWLTHHTDFGILTTLPGLAGKSGSFMAFKEHGVPVLCTEPGEQLKTYNISLDDSLTVVTGDNRPLIIPQKKAPAAVPLLEHTTEQFIDYLKTVNRES